MRNRPPRTEERRHQAIQTLKMTGHEHNNQSSLVLVPCSFAIAFVIVFIGCNQLNANDVSEQRKTELLLALGRDRNERVDNLPADEKRWLLEYIRQQRKEPSLGAAYELQFLQLGDEETMARYMEVFDNYPQGSYEIADSRQPRLIERMAPTMFHDEPYTVIQAGDVSYYPRSVSAAHIVARVLSTSSEIPEPVRRWAAETLKATDDPDILGKVRGNMRQWWKDNETAMRTRNWVAVKPGISVVGTAKSVPPLLEAPAPGSQAQAGSDSSKTTAEPLPVTGTEASGLSSNWSYCIIGVVAFLTVGLVVRFGIQRK